MTKTTTSPAVHQMVQLAGELAEMFSFNRSLGQIFGFLYLSAEPVSLEEIAATCNMSKANASLHLRTLEHWGAVRRSWKPGTRKDYYTAVEDLTALAIHRLQDGIGRRLEYAKQRLKAIKDDPTFEETMKRENGASWKQRINEVEKVMQQVSTGVSQLPKLLQLRKFFGD